MNPSVKGRRIDVVLAGNPVDEQLRVDLVGRLDCINHQFQQGTDDVETCQLNVQYIFGTVNLVNGHFGTALVGLLVGTADMLDKCSFKRTFQNGFFVFDEYMSAFVYQDADNGCSQIGYLFVYIGHNPANVFGPFFLLFIEKAHVKSFGFFGGEELELVGIFDVHHLVADVIGGFHQIDKRMAGVSQGLSFLAETFDAQFIGYFSVVVFFGDEEAEFRFLAGRLGRVGVFDDRCQSGVGHNKTAFAPSQKLVGEQTESIGISFEMG